MQKILQYKKFVWAILGFVLTVATGLLQMGDILPDSYTPWVVGVVTLLTALGVKQAKNAPLDQNAGHD